MSENLSSSRLLFSRVARNSFARRRQLSHASRVRVVRILISRRTSEVEVEVDGAAVGSGCGSRRRAKWLSGRVRLRHLAVLADDSHWPVRSPTLFVAATKPVVALDLVPFSSLQQNRSLRSISYYPAHRRSISRSLVRRCTARDGGGAQKIEGGAGER